MNPKPIIIAACCAIGIVVSVYFVGRYILKPNSPANTPTTSTARQKPGPTAKGHWHGDVWHDETTTDSEPKPGPTTKRHINDSVSLSNTFDKKTRNEWHDALREMASLAPSEEEIQDFYREQGLEPPPAGYTYIQAKDGNIQLIKDGEPLVEIYTENRFDLAYLSDKEWELYQALDGMTHKSIIETEKIPPEVVSLAQKKKEALEQKAQGPIPFAKALTIYSGLKTPADDERAERKIDEKLSEAYAQLGLRRDRTTYHYDYELINQLIIDFQKEVKK